MVSPAFVSVSVWMVLGGQAFGGAELDDEEL
jgi:hypothetical protein